MLGVVIGSACIVLVVTISLVGRNYIIAQIEGVGSNLVYGELVRRGSQSAALGDEITLADLDAVHRHPGPRQQLLRPWPPRDRGGSGIRDERLRLPPLHL